MYLIYENMRRNTLMTKKSRCVVITNGACNNGKNTFTRVCKDTGKCGIVIHTSSIIPAKKALCELIGVSMGWLEKNKTDKIRNALYVMKNLSININNAPSKFIANKYIEFLDMDSTDKMDILFIDIREPSEITKTIESLRSIGTSERVKFVTLHIERDSVHVADNPADSNTFEYTYDFNIQNNGTLDDLRDTASIFLDELRDYQKG